MSKPLKWLKNSWGWHHEFFTQIIHWGEQHENTCKITGKINSCWLNQLNASMGNIKYTCNVSYKLKSNSLPVKIDIKSRNNFLVQMPKKSSDFQFGKWFRKLDSNPLQKWCQNIEFVRRFRVITMRGNFARENFGHLHAPLEWQEVVWENSRGGGWTVEFGL